MTDMIRLALAQIDTTAHTCTIRPVDRPTQRFGVEPETRQHERINADFDYSK